MNEDEKEQYRKVSAEMEDYVAANALHALSKHLSCYYDKKAIILLDEYDTLMQEAYVYGYWKVMVEYIRTLFNSTFKTNPYLDRAVMTGITRVSKESIFSEKEGKKPRRDGAKRASADRKERLCVRIKRKGNARRTDPEIWICIRGKERVDWRSSDEQPFASFEFNLMGGISERKKMVQNERQKGITVCGWSAVYLLYKSICICDQDHGISVFRKNTTVYCICGLYRSLGL